MERTQIYLTPYQMQILRTVAGENRISMSEQIRRLIEDVLADPAAPAATKPATGVGSRMLAIAKRAEKEGWSGPPDLSSRVDHYLYGKDA
jgi:hypothetical protein